MHNASWQMQVMYSAPHFRSVEKPAQMFLQSRSFLGVHKLCRLPRRDMAALEGQAGTLDLAEPCARCGRALGTVPRTDAEHSGGAVPRYYLFPTGNAFHGACLAAEAMAAAAPQQRAKTQAILRRLAQVETSALVLNPR